MTPDHAHKRQAIGLLNLTENELAVLSLLAAGHTQPSAGRALHYSAGTVKECVARARRKLGAKNAAHAVALAYRSNLIGLS